MRSRKLQNQTLQKATQYFKTYEQREEAFRKSVRSLIPGKYLGPALFWKDFLRISFDTESLSGVKPVAYITGNPGDCLTFGTPWQVLTGAMMCAEKHGTNFFLSMNQIIRKFGLQENLYQPVRTLSGGETVKLAIAKSFIAATYSSRLSVASPFAWLSRDNQHYFKTLFEYYTDLDILVEIFALQGEDSDKPLNQNEIPDPGKFHKLDFSMYLKNVGMTFGAFNNSIYSYQTKVTVDDIAADFTSPCLLAGDNGQGKSLLARIMAKAIDYHGDATIICGKKRGRARLLFQDVISQTMLRTFNSLAVSNSSNTKTEPLVLYKKILSNFNLFCENNELQQEVQNGIESHTLVDIKAILAAVRLCTKPSALILDEPDWGLNRTSGIAFVLSVIKVSHSLKVPVILISHKSWWTNIVKSKIQITRTPVAVDSKGVRSFQVHIIRQVEQSYWSICGISAFYGI